MKRREEGASAVEFALIVPLLLMLVFGVIEFGVVLAQKSTVASAVRSGARYGSVNLYSSVADPHTCANVITRTRDQAVTVGMTGTSMGVSVELKKPDGTVSVVCSSPVNSTTVAGAGTSPPCTNANGLVPGTLSVKAVMSGSISIPIAGVVASPALDSTGTYTCEYK